MTRETTTSLDPRQVMDQAREFFTGGDAVFPASVEEEGETHVVFNTFRSRIVVAAFPDPDTGDSTRVRVSTLREDAAAAKFLTYVRTAESRGEGTMEGSSSREGRTT